MADGGLVLVLNAGSSSIRFAVFDGDLAQVAGGIAAEIGGPDATLKAGGSAVRMPLPNHAAALEAILAALEGQGLGPAQMRAAGHRVVHGGAGLTASARVTESLRAQIAACAPLAPLHNPHNLAAIDALGRIAPLLPQVACFDTAFHATNPEVATRYAIPQAGDTAAIRRYGFHGLSYANVVERLPQISGAPLPRRLLAAHLGNGASLAAILDGRSVANTMGYSPLDGLTMGTRSGSIDPNAVLDLAEARGIPGARRLLNNESGLSGLTGGTSDMRRLLAADDPASAFAVEHFCYWATRHAGSMIAAMGGLDALVFTGGIGENAAPVRARILAGLTWTGLQPEPHANDSGGPALSTPDSRVSAWIVPAEEERVIARDTFSLTSG